MKDDYIERDIVVTDVDAQNGKRVLIDAFMIATVREKDGYTFIRLKQEAAGEYIKVKESFDEVHAMKRRAMGLGLGGN